MSTLTDELRQLSKIGVYSGPNVTTCYAFAFNYEQTVRAKRACSLAAERLEEAERLLRDCERKIEAYKTQSRNEYPGGPLLQSFMPRLRAFVSAMDRKVSR